MRRLAKIVVGLAALGGVGSGLLMLTGGVRSTEDDKGVLATLISKALSSPGMQVSIGAVDGALTSDASIRDIVIADANGPWFRLDRARLVWTRSALLTGRLLVDKLEIGKLELLRKPLASVEKAEKDDGPLLPDLPVKVDITTFSLADLALGQDFLGTAAHLAAEGHAKLGNPQEGLDLAFDMRRTDAIGSVQARLAFAPGASTLKIGLRVHEDAGGLIARAASLPDQPPVDLDFNGDGKLDAFASRLLFAAGPYIGATGMANLDRRGKERVLTLDASAQIEGLLPEVVGPLFAGATRLGGAVHLRDDGAVRAEGVNLVAKSGRIDIDGGVGADKSIDGRISLHSTDEPGGVKAHNARIGSLAFDASAAGSLQAPRVSVRLLIDDARLPVGDFGHVEASVAATPNGPVSDPSTRLDLVGDARGERIGFADEGLADALGDRFDFSLRGRASPAGEADVSVARIGLETGEASYSGAVGLHKIAGRLMASAPDLSRFAALTGMKLKGALKAAADLSGAPADGTINATLDISADRLATGQAAVDALTGGRLTLTGGVGTRPRGGFGFSGLALNGRHFSASVDGEARREAADVRLNIVVPDGARVSPQLAGKGEVVARLTGSLDKPDLAGTIDVTNARALGRAIPRLHGAIDARGLRGDLSAQATLDGTIGTSAVRGNVAVHRNGSGWRVRTDNLAVGEVRAAVDVALSGAHLADGRVSLNAPNLDELSPLAMQKLAGRLTADLTLDSATGRQAASLNAHGSGLRLPSLSVDKLDAALQVADLFGVPVITGNASIDRANIAGEAISRLRADSKPAPQGSDMTLSAEVRGIALDANAILTTGTPARLQLNRFSARRGAQKVALAGPASFEFGEQGVTIRGLALATGNGRLTVDGLAGQRLDLAVSAKSIPLGLAALASPGLGLDGVLDGDARLTGRAAAPVGEWKLRIGRLMAPPMRSAGLPPAEISASGRLEGGRTSLTASVGLGKAGQIAASGFAPIDGSGRLEIAVNGALDAAVANTSLAASGRRLTGKLALDAKAEGSLANPRLSGTASLSGGSFVDPTAGVKLDRLEALVRAKGEDIVIEKATGATRNGGTIGVSGSVRAATGAGFPASLHIVSQRAELVSNQTVTAVMDLALDLSGPLARRPRVTGSVTLDEMNVSIPERLSLNGKPLANAVHVDPTRDAVERLALEKARTAKAAAGPAFNADIDLALSAPSRIFVRGRGVDAELGGDLKLTGTLDRPKAIGAFDMRRGRLDIAGQRLEFSKGGVDFAGDLIPNLDFVAQTTTSDVTVQVEVSGPATQPEFAFTSTPSLPQDEVISRLLFARAAGSLSAVQALQLAQTVAELSGQGGPGVFDKMRKSLGVDSLDVRMGADGKPTVGASRYITKNVNIGVRTGARPEDSAVSVGVDVTKHIRLQGDTGADGKASVGAGFEWEYWWEY